MLGCTVSNCGTQAILRIQIDTNISPVLLLFFIPKRLLRFLIIPINRKLFMHVICNFLTHKMGDISQWVHKIRHQYK